MFDTAKGHSGRTADRTRQGRELLYSSILKMRGGFAAVLLWLVDRLLGPVRARATDAGMTTAEYAVGTIAACGFAAILYQVVTGDSIISALSDLITKALSSL
ncbi:DUF4244 domain-containing protein [Cumulibacter soli]|uniref:DUF4244 domain-containing protein n=1 Tax=Cumulibacter soli TaxID=2546344 RepID=UPI001FBC1421|nr:DUF4244 domain-containing protein [Cumulibacter soli]